VRARVAKRSAILVITLLPWACSTFSAAPVDADAGAPDGGEAAALDATSGQPDSGNATLLDEHFVTDCSALTVREGITISPSTNGHGDNASCRLCATGDGYGYVSRAFDLEPSKIGSYALTVWLQADAPDAAAVDDIVYVGLRFFTEDGGLGPNTAPDTRVSSGWTSTTTRSPSGDTARRVEASIALLVSGHCIDIDHLRLVRE
jgi:hypothetical protein